MNKTDIKRLLINKECLFPTGKLVTWKKNLSSSSILQAMVEEIKEESIRLLSEPIPELSYSLFNIFEQTGERLQYERAYFEKRRRLNTFAIMVWIDSENKEYREQLHNIIWSICNEYTWCLPAHFSYDKKTSYSLYSQQNEEVVIDLFAAETGFALAEILQLIGEHLDPLIKKRVYQELYKRIFWPFQQQTFGWETATHNWAAVCAGSIGAAAIHLLQDHEELSSILERVLVTMDYYLEGFQEDGTCLEGYGYWEYGFGFFVYFADLLKKKTNDTINLFTSEKVHQIALFQQKTFLHKNKLANFSDAVPSKNIFIGLSHYLNTIYDDVEIPENGLRAHYTEDHCSRWAPAIRNLLWYRKEAKGSPWKDTTFFMEKSAWILSRKNGHAFAAKGGNNEEPHNHNDVGHFMLLADDEVFLQDLGSGMYTKDYFGARRYSYVTNGSQGHSVPIINGQYQKAGEKFSATILDVQIEQDVDQFSLDMSKAYKLTELNKFTRTFTWEKSVKPTLKLEDTYSFHHQPESIVERFITPIFEISKHEYGITLLGKRTLKINYDKNKLNLNIKKLNYLNHFGEKEYFFALDFTIINPAKFCEAQFVFQFE